MKEILRKVYILLYQNKNLEVNNLFEKYVGEDTLYGNNDLLYSDLLKMLSIEDLKKFEIELDLI